MRSTLALTLLLLSCGPTETAHLPPGPDDPAKNLAQLDVFADRVEREAMRASLLGTKPKPFGIRPLLSITDAEVAALNARLHDPRESQCLAAVHSIAVRMQSESDPRVAALLARIAPLRETNAARELAPLLRQLVAARNDWARERSHLPYLELMNGHRGYDPSTASRLEAEVRQALASTTAPPPRAEPAIAARFDAAHCLERASFVFEYLGLPRNAPHLQIRDAAQTGFSIYAFYPIDPPAEQAVTVRAGDGITPHWSTFHEYGHAAMSLLVEPSSCRTMKRPVSFATSESCAKIAERLFYAEEWLQSQGVPAAEIASLRDWERENESIRMRGILADIEFERALYRNPETAGGNPDTWALKRNLAFEPLARADYLLARCAQAAVYRRLRKLPGGLLGDAARKVVRDEVFRGATAMRFEEWFKRAIGEEPNCRAWLEDVVGWPATVVQWGDRRPRLSARADGSDRRGRLSPTGSSMSEVHTATASTYAIGIVSLSSALSRSSRRANTAFSFPAATPFHASRNPSLMKW